MAPKIKQDVEIVVGATGDGSVKSIKSQLMQAKEEAIQLAVQFGENSKQANDAAKKVAILRDRVEDLGIKIKGLNPDKFARIASIGQGVAQGFVAAQGAMALFGAESKDLEKTMVKLQGAIAFSQGLQGLKDLKLALGSAFLPLTVAAGIITVITANWKEFSGWITKSFPGFQKVIDFFENFRQVAAGTIQAVIAGFKDVAGGLKKLFTLDFSGAIEDFRKVGSDMAIAYNKGFDDKDKEIKEAKALKDRDFQLKLLAAQGQDVLDSRLKLQQDELALLEKGSDEYNNKLIEIETTRKAIRDRGIADAKLAEDKAQKDFLASYDVYIRNQQMRYAQEVADKQKAEDDKVKAAADAEKQFLSDYDVYIKNQQIQYAIQQADREKQLQQEKDLQKAKHDLIFSGLQAISDLSTLFAGQSEDQQKRAFEIQKGVSIATTLIQTFESAQKAFNSLAAIPVVGVGLGIAAATAATIAGLARVKQISQTKFNSSSAPSTPSIGTQAPNINPTINQQRQVVGNQTGATGQQTQTNAVKVYVTEVDITKTQNRTKALERRARVQ